MSYTWRINSRRQWQSPPARAEAESAQADFADRWRGFNRRLLSGVTSAGFIFGLLLLNACAQPPAAPPTEAIPSGLATVLPTAAPTPTQPPTAASTLSPPPTWTVTAPAIQNMGVECLNRAVQRGRPQHTADLMIFVGIVLEEYEAVVTAFNELARPCDGLALAAERAVYVDWQTIIATVPDTTLIWWISPSFALAQETADQWATGVDWFAYGPVMEERLTPAGENADLVATNRQANALAQQYNLVYSVGPSYQLTRRYAAELAADAQVFVTQNYGLLHDDPAGLPAYMADVADQIRAVNPAILLISTFGVYRPEDDPVEVAALVGQLIGDIDGIYVRTTGRPDSIAKLKTLFTLLRTGGNEE